MSRLLESVKIHRDGREVCSKTALGKFLYQGRCDAMALRQNYKCAICGKWMRPEEWTFDHQDGRGSGGGHRDDRIEIDGKRYNAALCWDCNGEKGSKRYEWVDGKFVPCA